MWQPETIHDLVGDESSCAYLEGRQARTQYKIIAGCTSETYQQLLERGWRRFGRMFFRPVCATCTACQSLRVEVERFTPNRSMRRTWRRNNDLTVALGRPRITADRLALYRRYHEAQSLRRGWPLREVTPLDYHQSFIEGHGNFAHEIAYRVGEELVGIALVDVLPHALSAVYAYFDPDQRRRGLGVFSILQQITLAGQRGLPRVYLGFWIEDNASMRYKAQYRPHEILDGRPEESEAPVWRPAGVASVGRDPAP